MVLPPEYSNALLDCSTRAISLQERYSLVAGCKFLVCYLAFSTPYSRSSPPQVIFVKKSTSYEAAPEAAHQLLAAHGQNIVNAIVHGIAGDAPRSAVPNLATLLSTMVSKLPSESRVWLQQSMVSVCASFPSICYPSARSLFPHLFFRIRLRILLACDLSLRSFRGRQAMFHMRVEITLPLLTISSLYIHFPACQPFLPLAPARSQPAYNARSKRCLCQGYQLVSAPFRLCSIPS